MSGSSANDPSVCQVQRLLILLIHIAHQRRQPGRVWLHWTTAGWQSLDH